MWLDIHWEVGLRVCLDVLGLRRFAELGLWREVQCVFLLVWLQLLPLFFIIQVIILPLLPEESKFVISILSKISVELIR